ncbi:MAG: OmpA family protein [Bradymonadaceae bacterium]|nr:OmpA family protein [Lujinxingiaceae bacterium]
MRNLIGKGGFWALVLMVLTLWAPNLSAQEFEYRVNGRVQVGSGQPSIELSSPRSVKAAKVTLERSDGNKQTIKLGDLRLGETRTIPLKQPKGKFTYVATVEGKDIDNDTISMGFNFDVAYVDAIALKIDRDTVDLGQGRVPFVSNRPVDRVEIEVFDTKSNKILERTQSFNGQSGSLEAKWDAIAEVGGIRLTVHDVDGFWTGMILEPFSVLIPHQTVVFDSGKSSWNKSEEPKLEATLQDIRKAIEEHAHKGLDMRLYIAGYTDTVGGAESNNKLSGDRARAIGQWFRKKGLKIPVYSQGFGESVLAVPTPDETPEERNRRALYILGDSPPPTSRDIPRGEWSQVR